MKTDAPVPAPLQLAARERVPVRLACVDTDALPDFRACILACDQSPEHPRSLHWRLPPESSQVVLNLGDLLEARFRLDDQLYSFDTIVIELVRSTSHPALWTTLPEEVEAMSRRRHRRVQPAQPVHLSLSLASPHDPLCAFASAGPGALHRGLLRNISVSGLNTVFPPGVLAHMHVGQHISVSLRLPDDVEEAVLDASIVYLRKRKRSKTVSCGVEFRIPPRRRHVRTRIAAFILRERKNHAVSTSGLRFW